ncbi:hypothetical protein V2J09_021587 [Rumex salicifolius]
MDQKKLPKSCDNKESIKIAMLKHEELFKQQVQELHRLYRKQKLLMNSMENANTTTIKPITIQQKEETADLKSEELIEESEIQLTLGPSIYKSKKRHSSSGQSLSSSNSTGSSKIQSKEANFSKDSTWEFTKSSQNSVQIENLGEENLRQDRMKQHPPWHFQALSLKLT